MRSSLETGLTVTVAISALTIAGSAVYRTWNSSTSPVRTSSVSGPPSYLADWKVLAQEGRTTGSPSAPLSLVQFVDYECPACRQVANTTIAKMRERFGKDLAITSIHFPLVIHRFADMAANAAECSAEQGSFEAMTARLYAGQDSMGLKSWWSYAHDAGATDSAAFASCMKGAASPRLAAGRALGSRLGISGTPTIILNGWRFASPPVFEELERASELILRGESPFPDG
jgi:protein-disulfide isomerase